MSNVLLRVGTRKAAFIYTSDEKRERWTISEPLFPGWNVFHMAADLRADPPRLYAAVNHPVWGPSVAKSTDLAKTWEQRSQGLGFPEDMQLAVTNVWFVQPGHETEPGSSTPGRRRRASSAARTGVIRGRPSMPSTGTTIARSGSPSRGGRLPPTRSG